MPDATTNFMKKLRIGFLSTAGIGRKNWKAILNSGNCVVSGVASRDAEKPGVIEMLNPP